MINRRKVLKNSLIGAATAAAACGGPANRRPGGAYPGKGPLALGLLLPEIFGYPVWKC